MYMTAQRARHVEKMVASQVNIPKVLPRECCSWPSCIFTAEYGPLWWEKSSLVPRPCGTRLGEKLPVHIKVDDTNNQRAVAVWKYGIIVGHVPREAGRTVWYLFTGFKYRQRLMMVNICNTNASHMLVYPIYSLVMSINVCVPELNSHFAFTRPVQLKPVLRYYCTSTKQYYMTSLSSFSTVLPPLSSTAATGSGTACPRIGQYT